VTVRDAIGHLPSPPKDGDIEHPDFANHRRVKITPINELRISHVPQGGGWQDIPEDLQLECHKKHRGQGHIDVFGRLHWRRPARTITAVFDSFSRGQYAHPVEHRAITSREAASLQSFPESFRFIGPKKDVARQIGNAVPPKLAEAIGGAIFSAIEHWAPKGSRQVADQLSLDDYLSVAKGRPDATKSERLVRSR
jgi:DNA (cytosine-5)-methyltransferase 1